DALDPEVASQGGTGLAGALRQGGELLRSSSDLADRVLVVFTDGEAHDTLAAVAEQAQQLRAGGIKLILVAEGGRTPSRIPVRDEHGSLVTYQRDEDGRVIQTARRDDVLGAIADAAQGTLAAASPAPARPIWPSSRRAARTTRRGTTPAPRRWRTRMPRRRGAASRTPRRRSTPTCGSAPSSISACWPCMRPWPTARHATRA